MKKNLSLLLLAMLTLVAAAYAADDAETQAPASDAIEAVNEVEAQGHSQDDFVSAEKVEGCDTTPSDIALDIESLDYDPEAKWNCMAGQIRWVPTSQCCCNGMKKELKQRCTNDRWVTIGSECIGLFCSSNCPE